VKRWTILFLLLIGLVGLTKPVYVDEQLESTEHSLLGNDLAAVSASMETIGISAGTYRITKTSPGSWTVSYEIRVNENKEITAVANKRFTTLRGNLVSSSLTYTSEQVDFHFRYKSGVFTSNKSVTATISNGRIVVT
jgi:hypothetical protein